MKKFILHILIQPFGKVAFVFALFCILLSLVAPTQSYAQSVPVAQDVVINEINYNPVGADDLEFLELYNRSSKSFDLKDFRFKDDTATTRTITTTSRIIAPNTYVVLTKDATLFAAAYPNVPVVIPSGGWPALNNDTEIVTLFYLTTEIDKVSYKTSWGGTDVSLERIDPNGASNASSNWGSCTDALRGTPNRQNSIYKPDVTAPKPVFARQLGDKIVEITFSEPLFPTSAVAANFTMGGTAATNLVLSADGATVTLTFAALVGSEIIVRNVRDYAGNTQTSATIILAKQPQKGELVINEIMYDPLADTRDNKPDQPEWLELYNRTSDTISLQGLYWTNAPDETGKADTLRVPVGLWTLPPNGYAVISAEPTLGINDPVQNAKIAKAYPEIDFSKALLIPMARTTLSFDNDGDDIRLHRSDGLLLDAVLYDPKWHHPNLLETQGISLERISPDLPTQSATSWTSSFAKAGATPSLKNNASTINATPSTNAGLTIEPATFSPDGDGKDEVALIKYTLVSPTSLIRARVYDTQGRLVRTLEDANLTTNQGSLLWDGYDDSRQKLRIGIYIVLLESVDSTKGSTEAYKAPVVLARKFN